MDFRIVEDYIKAIEFNTFQDFCDRLLMKLYPNDYTPVRAGGKKGDMKNDGYCIHERIFFQAHATRGESTNKTKLKIKNDLEGCVNNWTKVKKFVYITNDILLAEIERFVDDLREEYPEIIIETWSPKKIVDKIKNLPPSDIDYILEGRMNSLQTLGKDSIRISTKYLITTNFDVIKEISSQDLNNFPFKETLLYKNDVLEFSKNLFLQQDYRSTSVGFKCVISEEDYLSEYPNAKFINDNEGENWGYLHERAPTFEELNDKFKEDKIIQFLIKNGVPPERIAKILTCYEGECGGDGDFQELFLVASVFAQYLLVTNISNEPYKLSKLLVKKNDAVLFDESEIKQETALDFPPIYLEPEQSVLIQVGLFLSSSFENDELQSELLSHSYLPNQVQELNFGTFNLSNKKEYVGPAIKPFQIEYEYNGSKISEYIHHFDYKNIYSIDRAWSCGSCPHVFFVKDSNYIYMGEIFDVAPNEICSERILVPSTVTRIVIAELEQEVTELHEVKKNGSLLHKDLVLFPGDTLDLEVVEGDVLHIVGKYVVEGQLNILPKRDKYNLVQKFKKKMVKINIQAKFMNDVENTEVN